MTIASRSNRNRTFSGTFGAALVVLLILAANALAWNPTVCPNNSGNVIVPLEKSMTTNTTIYMDVKVDGLPQPTRQLQPTQEEIQARQIVVPNVVSTGDHYVEVIVSSKGYSPGTFKDNVNCGQPVVVPTPEPEQQPVTETPQPEQSTPVAVIVPTTPTRTVHRPTPKVTGGVATKWIPKRTNGTRGYRMKITGKFTGINLRGHVVKIQFIDVLPKGMVGENGAKVISTTPKKVKSGQIVRWNPKFYMTPYALYKNIRNCVSMRIIVDGHLVLTRTACAWTYDPPKVGQPVTYIVWSHGKKVLVTVPDPRLALGA